MWISPNLNSYKISVSVALSVLFCQIIDGTEPLNELFASDLTTE